MGIWAAHFVGPRLGGFFWALATALKWFPLLLFLILKPRTRLWGIVWAALFGVLTLAVWPQVVRQLDRLHPSGELGRPGAVPDDHRRIVAERPERGAELVVIPIDDHGEIIIEEYERLLTDRTRIVSLVHVSNALGTVNSVREMIQTAHAHGVPVLLDGWNVPLMRSPAVCIPLGFDSRAMGTTGFPPGTG